MRYYSLAKKVAGKKKVFDQIEIGVENDTNTSTKIKLRKFVSKLLILFFKTQYVV